MRNKGFTLIELLIVVAIIAILAAIAVPNFREASTRSKVARVKAELNVYASALEVYFVDNNTYMPSACPDRSMSGPTQSVNWYRSLTSPIAYMSVIAVDPFSRVEPVSWSGGEGQNPYYIYTGTGHGMGTGKGINDMVRATYLIASMGPNQENDTTVQSMGGSNFVLACLKDGATEKEATTLRPYDTTNGTKSLGDIYRFKDGYDTCCFEIKRVATSPIPRPG